MTETLDELGSPVLFDDPASFDAWNHALDQKLHFRGDPLATLETAVDNDAGFAMGPVLCAAYTVFSGAPLDTPRLTEYAEAARRRAFQPRERAHVDAMNRLVAGDIVSSAHAWSAIAVETNDLVAARIAHDNWLRVSNVADRLALSEAMVKLRPEGEAGWSFAVSMHAFALEEAGRYDEAERAGRRALDADADDLWALHALAHVYEATGNQDAALRLLESAAHPWQHHDGFNVHLWWHLSLRLIAAQRFDEVLAIHDDIMSKAKTTIRRCNLVSTLWRLELAGVDVGPRWSTLAELFVGAPETHTSGFIDMHQAMVWGRVPEHHGARKFFADQISPSVPRSSELGQMLTTTAVELVAGFQSHAVADHHKTVNRLGAATDHHTIGGSAAQRQIIDLTIANANHAISTN